MASTLWIVTASARLGPTFDEPFYLERGLGVWHSNSHRGLLKLGTMPLAADVQAFPLFIAEVWRGAPFDTQADFDMLLPWFRAGTLPFWWLLLTYAFLAGRHLAGSWTGRLAVAVLACEPNLLAHAGLATTDIALTACLLVFVYHFRIGRTATWPLRRAVPAFCFALLLMSKASGLVFGPLCVLAAELERLWNDPARTPWTWSPRRLLTALTPLIRDSLVVFPAGLALTFVLCGSDFCTEPSFVLWARKLPPGVGHDFMVFTSEHLRLFANAGDALVRQIRHNMQGHGAYILGQDHERAVWYYFPVLMTIKLPLPPLVLLLAAALVRPRGLVNWATAAAVLLLLNTVTCRVQIGIRFLLPAVVLLILGLSASAVRAAQTIEWPALRRGVVGLATCCVVWLAFEAGGAWPDGLRYVNMLWGGPDNGYRLVSDSNYDWGQGLRELAAWQRERHEPVAVWYYGTDPTLPRQPLEHLPLHNYRPEDVDDLPHCVHGRYLAVAVSLLHGHVLTESHRRAVTYLHGKQPIARTRTFLIYDLSDGAALDAERP